MNNEIITSLDNKLIKEARCLNDKKFRRIHGRFLVDGEKLVNEVVSSDLKVDKIFVEEGKLSDFDYILKKFDGKVVCVSSKVLNSISENVTPQGIIAEVYMKKTEEFVSGNDGFLVLDRIQDPGNLGTIIRTAVATGFNKIVLIDSVDPYSPKVVRSSSSGVFTANFYKMAEIDLISYCKENNIELLVADMGGENIFKTEISNKNFALVIGNEGQGISDEFRKNGRAISLPMKKEMESLNAGISASVLMYALKGKDI